MRLWKLLRFDLGAALLGALWRGYVGLWNAGLRLGGWWDLSNELGVVSIVRDWGGHFLDHGGAVYNARHPAFADVDDDGIIENALAAGATNKRPVELTGSWVVTEPITHASLPFTLRCGGRDNTVIRFAGYPGDPAIHLQQQRSEIHGGFRVIADSGADEYAFIGLLVEASRCVVTDYPLIYQADYGVVIGASCYGNHITADIVAFKTKGVHYEVGAHANEVLTQECYGIEEAGSKSFHDEGEENYHETQQTSEATTGFHGGPACSGKLGRGFVENVDTTVELEAGAELSWGGNGWAGRNIVPAGALLYTHGGHRVRKGFQHVPRKLMPLRGITAHYLFQEGTGDTIQDYSGNGRDMTYVGSGASWVDGPFGWMRRITSASLHRIPVAAITYNQPWTIIGLVRNNTWGAGDLNTLATIYQSSNTIKAQIQKATLNLAILRNGSSVGNFNKPYIDADDLTWFGYMYDGAATIYNAHGATMGVVPAFDSYALANPFASAVDTFEIGSGSNGNTDWGMLTVWDRMLTMPEVHYWMNQVEPVIPPKLFASLL